MHTTVKLRFLQEDKFVFLSCDENVFDNIKGGPQEAKRWESLRQSYHYKSQPVNSL